MSCRRVVHVLVVSAGLWLLSGCAVLQSETQSVSAVPALGEVLPVRMEQCLDRSGFTQRDLAAEASRLIEQRLRAASEFSLRDDAPLILSCEVTQFIEGSAFKRWLMPGWGSTVGQIAVMLSNAQDQSPVVIIHGNATVAAGGLYTVGADQYILQSAADDVIARLREWAAGRRAARP